MPMTPIKRTTPLLVLLAGLLLTASAAATIIVYKNDFKAKRDVAAMKKISGGKQCAKSWKGKKALGARAKQGRRACMLATPVRGDRAHPDHVVMASGTILKKTDKKPRNGAYVGVAVRAGKKSGYELRVFSKGRRWELLRNGSRERAGRSKAIAPIGKKNKLRIVVKAAAVSARVNKAKLGGFKDPNRDGVNGRGTAIAYGSTAKSKKDTYALFDTIRVGLP
jgi:hypothetical protein